jgi:DUF4097 and DUF4098 domain-containing protein YvlB
MPETGAERDLLGDNGVMSVPATPAPERLQLRIATASGKVTVTAEDRSGVVVDRGGTVVPLTDGVVEVKPLKGSAPLEVRCPTACDLVIGTASGRVELRGVLGAVSVTSASGSIRVAEAAEADLRTQSGRVEIEDCRAGCRVATKSGSITVGAAGSAELSTVSGTIRVTRVDGEAQARTVSGGMTIGSNAGGPVRARSVSGGITVHLPAGVRPAVKAISARAVEGGWEPGDDVLIEVGTVSGSVVVTAR